MEKLVPLKVGLVTADGFFSENLRTLTDCGCSHTKYRLFGLVLHRPVWASFEKLSACAIEQEIEMDCASRRRVMNKVWGRQTKKPCPIHTKLMEKSCAGNRSCIWQTSISTTRRRMKKSDFNFWLTRENYFSIYKFRFLSRLPPFPSATCVLFFVLSSPWQRRSISI